MQHSKIKIFNYPLEKLTTASNVIEDEIDKFCSNYVVRDIKFVESTKHKKEYIDDAHILYKDVEVQFISFIIFYNESY
jgi:hypothetical protein